MSLQKQLVHLNLTGGLQKKDDQFLVIPSKLAVADNVQFDDASTIVRRGGQSSVSLTSVIPSLSVGRGERLFAHRGVAHIESRGGAVGALPGGVHRVASSGGTAPVGNATGPSGFSSPYHFRRAGMVTERVSRIDRKPSVYGVTVPYYDGSYDFAIVDGYRYYAFETRDTVGSGRQTIRVVIVNDSSGFVVVSQLLTPVAGNVLVKPRIVALSGKTTYLYYGTFTSGGVSYNIECVPLSSAGVGTANSVFTSAATGGSIEGTANDAVLFDAAYTNTGAKLGLVARDATAAGTTLLFKELSPSDGYTISSSTSGTASARVQSLTALFVTSSTPTYRLHALYGINTAVAKGMYFTIGVGVSAESTIGTAPAGTVGRIAAYEASDTLIYMAFDAISSTGANNVSVMRLASFSHTYASLSECASTGPWVIAGRIASCQSRLYLPMAFVSKNYQSTYYVIDLSDALGNLGVSGNTGSPWQVLARIDYGEGALDSNRWQLTTRVPNLSVNSDELDFAYLRFETDLRLAGTSNETPYAICRANIDLQSQLGFREINGVSWLAGACPYVYDGSNMVEEGFHHGPDLDTSAALGATGYELPNVAGDYVVCFTVAWQDGAGNWWESAPSNERTFTVGANRFIPTSAVILPPTQKPNYVVLMYRTKALGTDTSLYLATKQDGTFVTSDTDLDDGEQLYTAGNVLPNTPAPACRHVSVFQKRLVLSGCGDGSRVYWSKQTTPGYGVEFSSGDPTHQMQVPSDKGRVVATEEMDDRLVIVCENGVGIIGGQGPDATGTAGQYSDFSSIITETGCSWDSPKSVIRGPEGVWFRSPFGIRLISRSGSLGRAQDGKQAGAEVDSLVSGNVVAVAGDAKQQLRFYQSSGTVLVWDYQWQQWTRFTGTANVDACYADDRFYHLSNYSTTTPLLRYTDETAFFDVDDAGTATSNFTGYVETAWLSFAGIQGFQRIYRLMILGRMVDNSVEQQTFDLYLGFDFDITSPPDDETANLTLVPAANGFVQIQHHLARQKCEALKIGLSFRPKGSSNDTGRLRITDLTLQVGVKPGYYKLPSSQRF